MADDRSPDYLRGFIAPMQDFTAANQWGAESVMTQGTGRAGVPAAQQSSALVVTARGEQSKDLDIRTESAGNITDSCGFTWKNSSDPNYMGGDVPTVIGDYVVIQASATESFVPRSAVNLPEGEILVAVEHSTVTNNNIRVTRISTDGSTTSVTLDSAVTTTLSGESRFPELVIMPDDSVLCLYWVCNSAEELAQIEVQRTTDRGATWILVSSRALPADIDIQGAPGAGAAGNELGRITAASTSSQVLMFVNLTANNTSLSKRNYVMQYASTASGLKYVHVDTTGSSEAFWHQCLVSWDDAYIMAWVQGVDSIAFTRLSSAYESVVTHLSVDGEDTISSGNVAVTSSNALSGTNMDMWVDPSGRLYLAWANSPSAEIVYGAYSELAGVSFEEWGKTWYFFGRPAGVYASHSLTNAQMVNLKPPSAASASGLEKLVGISTGGSQSIFCNWLSGGGSSWRTSLVQYRMGGWSTVNMPATARYPQDMNRGFQDLVWIPADLPPQDAVWTKVLTGSATETLTTLLRLSAAAGEALYYKRTLTDKAGGLIVRAQISGVTGGNSVLAIGNGLELQMQERTASSNTIKVRILVLGSAIYIYDRHAGSPNNVVASVTGLSLSKTDILVWLDNDSNSVTVHYCEAGAERKYSKLTAGSLSLNVATTQEISWGVISLDPSGAQQADWHFIGYSTGAAAGLGLATDPIVARRYPGRGYYANLSAGLQISTTDGPARIGDEYRMEVRYDHPADNVLYSVSPSRDVAWMSTKITTDPDSNNPAEEKIAWAVDASLLGAQVSQMLNDSIGLHLSNVNFREFTVQTYSGSWSNLVTVDNSVDYPSSGSFNFSRAGRTVINIDTPGTWLHLNESAGWRISLDDGAGSTVIRRIRTNSEGVLGSTSSKKAILQLEDAKPEDPATGTAYLIPDSVTVLMHDMANIAGIRIVIPAQRTREGQFQIGQMVLGPLVIPASQYGRGRTIAWSPDIMENEQRNGVIRSQRQGRGGRTIRIAWQDGVDISDLYVSAADPNYWKACTGGDAVAAVGSAPTDMIGLVQHVEGSQEALVYLPSISRSAATSEVINRYHDHMIFTFASDVQIDSVVGDELRPTGDGEVFRVGTVVLRETR